MNKPRKFEGDKLVVATHNPNKLKELENYLAPLGIALVSAADMKVEEPEETEDSFIGNAVLKASHAAKATDMVCLADDSGLSVEALDGAPGIYSARWAEDEDGNRDWQYAMATIENKLEGKSNRRARFVCAIALCWPDGHTETVEGYVDGTVVWPPRGSGSFGYDPIFEPNNKLVTFGEMLPEEKKAISHRSDAIHQIMEKCFR